MIISVILILNIGTIFIIIKFEKNILLLLKKNHKFDLNRLKTIKIWVKQVYYYYYYPETWVWLGHRTQVYNH
jgi:hypothetical protein